MNRKQRRALRQRTRVRTVGALVAGLERFGPILWEPEPADGRREGWAICPCCGERELWLSVPLDDDTRIEDALEAS